VAPCIGQGRPPGRQISLGQNSTSRFGKINGKMWFLLVAAGEHNGFPSYFTCSTMRMCQTSTMTFPETSTNATCLPIGDFPDYPPGRGHCTFEILLHHALKTLSLVKAVTQFPGTCSILVCCRCRSVLMHKSGRSFQWIPPRPHCSQQPPGVSTGPMMLLVCTAGSTFHTFLSGFKWATCGALRYYILSSLSCRSPP